MAPLYSPDPINPDTTTGQQWSKEALFGLLGIIAVILAPCVGLLIRCSYLRWCQTRRQESSQKENDIELESHPCRFRRCKRLRLGRVRSDNRTFILVV
ncbi:hypothetical protein IQ06DRAFT_141270 [Phaeosphaeriaceae sp. SRC1lsM3a]|nr:hypothetical protein IQ06DRAFT_141270 [Stagonospora sp. SRC1lsM3a]